MSEIRINIFDQNRKISGEAHGFFGDALVAALTAEPETIEELESALQRFIERESDWSPFRMFRGHEDFEPYDAGIVIIDLAAKLIASESTYSAFSRKGTIRIVDDDGNDFGLPYRLSDEWKIVSSILKYNYLSEKRREKKLRNPRFDARKTLYGQQLFEFIISECAANRGSEDENLFAQIHAKWLMLAQDTLGGKTPREILLDKQSFIDFELHSRALQYSVTRTCPSPLPKTSNAFIFSGFGTHEIVVYYNLIRFLLDETFSNETLNAPDLAKAADHWLNSSDGEHAGRLPAFIIESERSRMNLTMSAHECLIDEDCEICQMMAADFDTPAFWHLDGSDFEYDMFEFSFFKTFEEWEADQREMEKFNREFNAKYAAETSEFPEFDEEF